MKVRWGRLEDAEHIAAVHVDGWRVGYRGQLPDPLLNSLEPHQRVPRWAQSLQTSMWPTSGTLVAESEAQVILGFAHLMATRDTDDDLNVSVKSPRSTWLHRRGVKASVA